MEGNYFYLKYGQDIHRFLENEFITGYNEAYKFYIFHGNLNVPLDYTVNSYKLGHFLELICQIKDELTANQRAMFEIIDINWDYGYPKEEYKKPNRPWEEKYALAKKFYHKHHHLKVPNNYKIGLIDLGSWIATQRTTEKKCILHYHKMEKLDNLHMIYSFDHLEEIVRVSTLSKGALAIPEDYLLISPFSNSYNPFIKKPKYTYHNAQLPFFKTRPIYPKYYEKHLDMECCQEDLTKKVIISDIRTLLKMVSIADLNQLNIDNLNDKSIIELLAIKNNLLETLSTKKTVTAKKLQKQVDKLL